MNETGLTHLDEQGRPRMVDVSAKDATFRVAVAHGWIRMSSAAFAAVETGSVEKGNVLLVAELAGIQAAKRTADLIPLCHPLALTSVQLTLTTDEKISGVRARAEVRLRGRTGVEMEALTAVSCALLTVYDMCKALDSSMQIGGIEVVRKSGGRSDFDREAG